MKERKLIRLSYLFYSIFYKIKGDDCLTMTGG